MKASADFRAWIARGKRTSRDVADSLGVDTSTLSRYLNDKVTPPVMARKLIEVVTGGEVKQGDWE